MTEPSNKTFDPKLIEELFHKALNCIEEPPTERAVLVGTDVERSTFAVFLFAPEGDDCFRIEGVGFGTTEGLALVDAYRTVSQEKKELWLAILRKYSRFNEVYRLPS